MTKEYFNQLAAAWDEVATEKDLAKLEQLARRLDIKPGATVLDVGTGTGVFIPLLLKKIGGTGRLVCLDFAEEMLHRARAKGFEGNISYLCTNIENSRLADKSFDAVVCYSSFPHFQNKPRALREINRLLKKGGHFFICHTSSRATINEIHRQIPEVQNDIIPDERKMRQMLSTAGFADIAILDGTDRYLASARKMERATRPSSEEKRN